MLCLLVVDGVWLMLVDVDGDWVVGFVNEFGVVVVLVDVIMMLEVDVFSFCVLGVILISESIVVLCVVVVVGGVNN